jgi:hypothetical protein
MVAQGMRRGRNDGNRQSTQTRGAMGQMGHMIAKPQEVVSDYPFSSALLVFGIGLGVGVMLSSALCESTAHMWQPETTSQRWSRQMSDYLGHMVPEAVSKRFTS